MLKKETEVPVATTAMMAEPTLSQDQEGNNEVGSIGTGIMALAFLGDAVYEQYMRYQLLHSGIVKGALLSEAASALACAEKQADLAHAIEGYLTPSELAVLRRGRNAKPRHQSRGEVVAHRWATGLEALLGYLSYSEQEERLKEVLHLLWQLAHPS
ncbi:MAG: ribonuclease III [Symbiobacteriaceae bacterium]|nr:ribonuclease III [Symbiobacteriaceae bacterium]